MAEQWTAGGLVNLLAKQVRKAAGTISHGEMIAWLSDVVAFLTGTRDFLFATQMRCRTILARKLRKKIATIRAQVRKRVYQKCLFAPEAKPEVSFANGFQLHNGMFVGVPTYHGTKYRFAKHPDAFWLPLTSDCTYLNFVAKLKDGNCLLPSTRAIGQL